MAKAFTVQNYTVGDYVGELFDDEAVRALYAKEEDSPTHSSSLFPNVPTQRLSPLITKTVKDVANTDPDIRRLARQLSDEVEGVGIVSALVILAKIGMWVCEREGK